MGFYILGFGLPCSISHFSTEASRGGTSDICPGRWGRGVSELWKTLRNGKHWAWIRNNPEAGGRRDRTSHPWKWQKQNEATCARNKTDKNINCNRRRRRHWREFGNGTGERFSCVDMMMNGAKKTGRIQSEEGCSAWGNLTTSNRHHIKHIVNT